MKDTYVVIPALEPPQKFYDYLRKLTAVEQIFLFTREKIS